MFNLCAAMKWQHLPMAGGIYDQSPDFIAGIEMIFEVKGRKEKREADEAKRKSDAAGRKR